MQISIKPYHHNLYPKRAILIRGNSPLVWISEISKLNLQDAFQFNSYAISNRENNIVGCLIIFNQDIKADIQQHSVMQFAGNSVFIPEFSAVFPKISDDEWITIFNGEKYIIHPEFGFQKLDKAIDWEEVLSFSSQLNISSKKPENSVKIPSELKSLQLELDTEKILKDIENSFKKENAGEEDLPFDLKKIMAGNKKELEKYLKFMEQNPEKALQYAIPLDVLNSSRGSKDGKFTFGNSWFSKIFGNSGSEGSSSGGSGSSWWNSKFHFVWIFLVLLQFAKRACSTDYSSNKEKQQTSQTVEIESTPKEIPVKYDSIVSAENKKMEKKNAIPNPKQYDERISKIKDSLLKAYDEKIELKAEKQYIKNKKLAEVYNKEIKKLADSSKNHKQKELNINYYKKYVSDSLKNTYGYHEFESKKTTPPKAEEKPIKVNNDSRDEKISITDGVLRAAGLIFIVVLAIMLFGKRNSSQSTADIISFGESNQPFYAKLIAVLIIIFAIVYLLKPLIEMYGYNIFVIVILVIVFVTLYKLLNKNKTLLKDDDDEKK